MTDRDEQLPGEIARRNWVILAILVLLSLAWGSARVTLGVLCGGLTAIGGYHWLHRSLKRMLAVPSPQAARGFQFGYIIRLAALAATLLLLVAVVRVHPVGLAAGLSVVIVSILWTTVKRTLFARRQ